VQSGSPMVSQGTTLARHCDGSWRKKGQKGEPESLKNGH